MTQVIDVTRPPLNLYEASRVTLSTFGVWVPIFAPPRWRVPPTPIDPELISDTAALISNAFICNLGSSPSIISVRTTDGVDEFPIVLSAGVLAATNLSLNMRRAIVVSGEEVQAQLIAGPSVAVHMSFILNTRERVQVIG